VSTITLNELKSLRGSPERFGKCGLLQYEIRSSYEKYSYFGNMGDTYEKDIRPIVVNLFDEDAASRIERDGRYLDGGRNIHDTPSYSWVVIVPR
jgi:hypothetical protein